MDANERAILFQSAMEDYRARLHTFAASSLRKLVEDGSTDPAHLSYYGLLMAMTEGRFESAIAHCRRAIEKDGRRQSDLYLNLGRVLAMSRRRGEAIEALTEGLAKHPEDRKAPPRAPAPGPARDPDLSLASPAASLEQIHGDREDGLRAPLGDVHSAGAAARAALGRRAK